MPGKSVQGSPGHGRMTSSCRALPCSALTWPDLLCSSENNVQPSCQFSVCETCVLLSGLRDSPAVTIDLPNAQVTWHLIFIEFNTCQWDISLCWSECNKTPNIALRIISKILSLKVRTKYQNESYILRNLHVKYKFNSLYFTIYFQSFSKRGEALFEEIFHSNGNI